MENILVKHTKEKGAATTITIKVSAELKRKWERFCIDNDINKSKTIQNVLNKIMEGK